MEKILVVDDETGILEVLPKGLESVRALRDFQKHFTRDRQVVVLLRSGRWCPIC